MRVHISNSNKKGFLHEQNAIRAVYTNPNNYKYISRITQKHLTRNYENPNLLVKDITVILNIEN